MPRPGIATYESRGNEITVAFLPLPGMCISIIVSVLALPPSSWVPRAASSPGVAPVRLSLPNNKMFSSDPSMSLTVELDDPETITTGAIGLPTAMLLLKLDHVFQTQ